MSSNWTHAGASLPWLRGQAVHVVAAGAGPLVTAALTGDGFTLAECELPTTGYQPVAGALRLPGTAGANLDALADSLRDLPGHWPGCQRLGLLVHRADRLARADLLTWTELCLVLRRASSELWDAAGLVFETVLLVPDSSFGADHPPP